MKLKKVLISWILMVLIMTACSGEPKKLAVLIYDIQDPFIALIAENIVAYSHPSFQVDVYDCQNSQIKQNDLAEQLFSDGVDLMIVNPVDRLSAYAFSRRGEKEGIPVIFFNREPLEEDIVNVDHAYYVGADAEESGLMQANIIDEYFQHDPLGLADKDFNGDGIIQTVILKGELGHQDAEERSAAVIESLIQKGYKVELLTTVVANWNEDAAYRSMEDLMDQWGGDIELLISNNDAMAIGASRYLMDKDYYKEDSEGGLKVPFPIVSIDGLPMALEAIEAGYLYGTVINDGQSMAKAIADLSSFLLGTSDKMTEYELSDERYIWISYREYLGQ